MRDLPERLEELAGAYAQVAARPDPAELRRRRHRRRRRAAAAGSLMLAAVLLVGAVVASGRVGATRRPAPGPAVSPPSIKATRPPPPQTTRPARLTGTITRPQEGYQLQLPAGWYAVQLSEPKQLALEYGRQQGRSAAEVFVRTALTLDPRLTSAADRKAAVLASSPWGPDTETFADKPATAATRPDGRRFLRIDVNLVGGGIPDLLYQIAWPYHCAPNSACPASARLRVLEFVASSSKDQWARVQPMLEHMVAAVRPIGNAIGGVPAHPPCAYGRNGDVNNPYPAAKATGDGGVLLQVGVASRGGLPCHFRGELAIRLVDRLRAALTTRGQQPPLLQVRNNGATVALDGDLPEGSARSGVLSVTWRWTNWCGSKSVRAQVVGPGGEITDLALGGLPLPRCTDRTAPSILTLVQRHG